MPPGIQNVFAVICLVGAREKKFVVHWYDFYVMTCECVCVSAKSNVIWVHNGLSTQLLFLPIQSFCALSLFDWQFSRE